MKQKRMMITVWMKSLLQNTKGSSGDTILATKSSDMLHYADSLGSRTL